MHQSLIQKIVKASGVKANELVLVQFWGEDKDIRLMHKFAEAAVSLGASPVELQQSRTANAERFASCGEDSFTEKYFSFLSGFDAVLDIFTYRPVVLDTALSESKAALYRKYMRSLFESLMKAERFTQIRIPTEENALESPLPAEDYIRRMTAAYDVDYDQVRNAGKARILKLSKDDTLILSTDRGCQLHFTLTGRQWHLDAGDGDLPCGEVYIAPLEGDTNGKVFFETLYADAWGQYENVTLTVESGVVTADDPRLNAYLAELEVPDRTVCELGFGLNPNVKDICGYAVLDEKAQGTFHIAIGANEMFGGANPSGHHMDFVGCGTIEK